MCSYTLIKRLNRRVLKLGGEHPAKKFLSAFIQCRLKCVGREIEYPGRNAIDQTWTSSLDGKEWTFSSFAYGYISFSLELDGFVKNASYLTESEICAAEGFPNARTLMNECAAAARQCGNTEILRLTHQVLEMYGLWEQYLDHRKEWIAREAAKA